MNPPVPCPQVAVGVVEQGFKNLELVERVTLPHRRFELGDIQGAARARESAVRHLGFGWFRSALYGESPTRMLFRSLRRSSSSA